SGPRGARAGVVGDARLVVPDEVPGPRETGQVGAGGALRDVVAESGERLACAAGLPPAALGAERGEEGDLAGGVVRGGAALGAAGGGAGGGCLQFQVAEDGGLADGGGCGGGHALAEGVGHLFDDLGADVGGDAHAAPPSVTSTVPTCRWI